ncbi:MAG: ABC transporter permease [Patulibacter minatonensis]
MSDAAAQLALVAGFAVAALAIARAGGLPLGGAVGRAAARATVQLLVVGALLAVLTDRPWLVAGFFVVMWATATTTASGRIGVAGLWPAAAAAIAVPSAVASAALLGSGAVPVSALSAVATTGILVGGAMSAASLTGRALVRELAQGRERIEARLLLGDSLREASAEAVRHAVTSGVVPALDQARTVGLIALPGTFVGLVLGGASPAVAARVQLLVLVGLIAVELAAGLVAAHAIVRRLTVPGAERLAPLASSRTD